MKRLILRHAESRAAIYSRVSTDKQEEEGVSLDGQLRANLAYAASHGFTVAEGHIYREASSGGEIAHRAALQRCLASARAREFDVLVCYCLDRLTRDPFDLGWLKVELSRHKVELVFASETFSDSMEGDLMMSLRGVFGKEERRKISKRTRAAYEEHLKQGHNPGLGPPPYGYTTLDGALVVDEDEAAVVRRLFDWAVEGFSLSAMARQLNQEGVSTPSAATGKTYARKATLWSVGTLAGLLRDPIYRGQRAARRQRSVAVEPGGGKNCVARPREEWAYTECAAIVTEEEWNGAQVKLGLRTGVNRTRNESRPALLRGLIRCHCGCRLAPNWTTTGALHYRCASRGTPAGSCGSGAVKGAEVERWAVDIVTRFLADPAALQEMLEEVATSGCEEDLASELGRLARERQAVETKQSQLLDLGDLAREAVRVKLKGLDAELERIDAAVLAVKGRQQGQAHATLEQQRLASYCQEVALAITTREEGAAWLQEFDFATTRQAFENLGVLVTASGRRKGKRAKEWRLEIQLPAEYDVGNLGPRTYFNNALSSLVIGRRAA